MPAGLLRLLQWLPAVLQLHSRMSYTTPPSAPLLPDPRPTHLPPPSWICLQIKLRHERLVAMSKKPVVEGESA